MNAFEHRTYRSADWSIRSRLAIVSAALVTVACHDSTTAPPVVALRTPTCGTASVVQLGVNHAATFVCSGGTFVNLAGGAKYLIVPQFASGGLNSSIADAPVSYQIGVPAAAPASIVARRALPGLAVKPHGSTPSDHPQYALDAALRDRARRAVKSAGWRVARVAAPGVDELRAAMATAALPSLGSLRDFHALTNIQSFTYTIATARLSFIGNNVLLYVDTLAPANGFTAAQLQSFGQYFDQVLYGLDVAAFGPPSDIDGNGHIIMLLSPTVNGLTTKSQCMTQGYVAGYFDGTDFGSGPNSNQGEVFYSVVPDPNGTVSCAHSVANLLLTVPATFLHELQHLISFSQHVVIHGGDPEEGWLDEGMSIRAEELGSEYFEAKYPPPLGRTDPSQLFPDSSQGFVGGFLPDSYIYLLRADTASLTLHDDSQNGFSWRGGDWLLVHWLGDLRGKSIFMTLDQSTRTGIANISAAAGESFASLFGDFSLAMWTDSLVGVPRSSVPAPDRLQTRNLRQLYQRLFVANPGNPAVPRPYPVLTTPLTSSAGGLVTATMVPGTMAFYILDLTGVSGTVAIQFSAPGGATFPTTLAPQVSLYRLPN